MTCVGHHSTRSQHIPIQPILHDHFLARCDNQPVEIHWKTCTFKFAVHTSHPCPLGEVILLEGVCYGPLRTVHRTLYLFGDISSLLTCLKQKFTSTRRSTLHISVAINGLYRRCSISDVVIPSFCACAHHCSPTVECGRQDIGGSPVSKVQISPGNVTL